MFIPKANRIAVFSYLFREGVCVVKKDTVSPTHPHIEGATNLEVLNLMKSLQSKGYIRITFLGNTTTATSPLRELSTFVDTLPCLPRLFPPHTRRLPAVLRAVTVRMRSSLEERASLPSVVVETVNTVLVRVDSDVEVECK
ncbi:40S ribosomal protein S10 [Skeletonema marinoi]|uniref:40S ribosomal protein S10 n=1 Tax=Skeletonema marinoi TaxID=267567 RepID=A0AAD9DJB2_9STRA|nr:40S ribosomal protein S10 [Skeletonema marinoi]